MWSDAAEWVRADAARQMDAFARTGRRPRLDKPPASAFLSEDVREEAIRMRKVLCDKRDHVGERLLAPDQYYRKPMNVCKACTRAMSKSQRDAVRPAPVVYETAEAFLAAAARETCKTQPQMTVGRCRTPKADEFTTTLEFERAKVLRERHHQEYLRQYRIHRPQEVKERTRKQSMDAYREKKETEEGRRQIQQGHARKKARMADPEHKEYAFRMRVADTRKGARTRGLAYQLSEAKERELFSLDATCFHCGVKATGVCPLGPDRLYPEAMAYTDDGTVSCCKSCNYARNGMEAADFHQACTNVARYQTSGVATTRKMAYVMGNSKHVQRNGASYSNMRHGAYKKGLAVEITKADHALLTSSKCYLCGVTGRLGFDRKDSDKGYTPDNSFPCCTCCNMMKNRLPFDDFVALCARVASLHVA